MSNYNSKLRIILPREHERTAEVWTASEEKRVLTCDGGQKTPSYSRQGRSPPLGKQTLPTSVSLRRDVQIIIWAEKECRSVGGWRVIPEQTKLTARAAGECGRWIRPLLCPAAAAGGPAQRKAVRPLIGQLCFHKRLLLMGT